MKQQIYLMAQLLMLRNTRVSTLECKNAMHGAFSSDPTYSLTQKEVSSAMAELYAEHGWHRELNTTVASVAFYEYSMQPVAAVAVAPAVSTPAPASQPASQSSNTTTLKALDSANGSLVCYVAGKPDKFVQANDRNGAKKLCFQTYEDGEFGLTYNNLNVCTVDYFNKRKI